MLVQALNSLCIPVHHPNIKNFIPWESHTLPCMHVWACIYDRDDMRNLGSSGKEGGSPKPKAFAIASSNSILSISFSQFTFNLTKDNCF